MYVQNKLFKSFEHASLHIFAFADAPKVLIYTFSIKRRFRRKKKPSYLRNHLRYLLEIFCTLSLHIGNHILIKKMGTFKL